MEENQNFKVGDWVFYNKYGVGVVEKECDTNYSIRFEDKSRVINKKYYKNIEKRENDGWKTVEIASKDFFIINFWGHDYFRMYVKLPFMVNLVNEYLQCKYVEINGEKYYFSQIHVNYVKEKIECYEPLKRKIKHKHLPYFFCTITFQTIKDKRSSPLRLYKQVFSNIEKKEWTEFVKERYGEDITWK